jgi:hypothetical protein
MADTRAARLAALPFVIGVVGCGGALPHPPYASQATSALRRVEVGPPPGRVERIPPRPEEATAWIDGEWIWMHGRWYWLVGRWVETPAEAKYAPSVTVFARDGSSYWAPGVWLDAKGQPMAPPPPLALARPSLGAVVDPEGNVDVTGRTITTVPTWTYRPEENEEGGSAPQGEHQ